MKRVIKFRRPYFRYSDNKFEYFDYWGVDIKIAKEVYVFRSPGTSSHHYGGDDQQFTGKFDEQGVEIYEGDIIGSKDYPKQIVFYNGSFGFWDKENSIPEFFMLYRYLGSREKIGDIYSNPELL